MATSIKGLNEDTWWLDRHNRQMVFLNQRCLHKRVRPRGLPPVRELRSWCRILRARVELRSCYRGMHSLGCAVDHSPCYEVSKKFHNLNTNFWTIHFWRAIPLEIKWLARCVEPINNYSAIDLSFPHLPFHHHHHWTFVVCDPDITVRDTRGLILKNLR